MSAIVIPTKSINGNSRVLKAVPGSDALFRGQRGGLTWVGIPYGYGSKPTNRDCFRAFHPLLIEEEQLGTYQGICFDVVGSFTAGTGAGAGAFGSGAASTWANTGVKAAIMTSDGNFYSAPSLGNTGMPLAIIQGMTNAIPWATAMNAYIPVNPAQTSVGTAAFQFDGQFTLSTPGLYWVQTLMECIYGAIPAEIGPAYRGVDFHQVPAFSPERSSGGVGFIRSTTEAGPINTMTAAYHAAASPWESFDFDTSSYLNGAYPSNYIVGGNFSQTQIPRESGVIHAAYNASALISLWAI